jgi:hypothetical protein
MKPTAIEQMIGTMLLRMKRCIFDMVMPIVRILRLVTNVASEVVLIDLTYNMRRVVNILGMEKLIWHLQRA